MEKKKGCKWIFCIVVGLILIFICLPIEKKEESKGPKCLRSECDNICFGSSLYCVEHYSQVTSRKSDSKSTRSSSTSGSYSSSKTNSYEECFITGCTKPQTKKTYYCYTHACGIYGKEIVDDLESGTISVNEAMKRDNRNKGSNKSSNKSNNKSSKRYDPYDVYDYDDPDDFADEWAEEFDDDYDDGFDDAYDYWEDEHE